MAAWTAVMVAPITHSYVASLGGRAVLAALELCEEVVLRVEVAGRAPAAVPGPQLARTKRPRPAVPHAPPSQLQSRRC